MKKRKIRYDRLFFIFILIFLLIYCLFLLLKKENDFNDFNVQININELDYSDMQEFDIDLYSKSYMLVRLNDFKVLYGKNIYKHFFPASLAKVVTLNTVVKYADSLDDLSSINDNDYQNLINANASLAGIKVNSEYTIKDLLYALILPSGGDAAFAIENYFNHKGESLIYLIKKNLKNLNINDSSFTNTTGLHDDNLYTTLDDYARVVIDTLNYGDAKNILKSYEYTLKDGLTVKSTLTTLNNYFDNITIYGGKTGFTGEAGENLMVLYTVKERSYLLILTNAPGNPYKPNENFHFNDAISVLEYLYK